ncbi:MAG: hypothetical protein JWQ98_3588 [Chlorobi bacterium]|nr:hypothetical protein [Chlorobiota bacterium]
MITSLSRTRTDVQDYIVESFDLPSPSWGEFRDFTERLYGDDPFWSHPADPPADAGARAFIVRADGRIVAGACCMINDGICLDGQRTALVGWYEAMDDPDAAARLFDGIAEHYRGMGCRRLLGPLNGSTWHRYRVALPSDADPFFLDVRNRPWYAAQWEGRGFATVARYFSTKVSGLDRPYDRVGRFEEIYRSRGVTVRPVDTGRFEEELLKLYRLSLEGFAGNLFYTPISFESFRDLYMPIRPLVDPAFVLIASGDDGRPLAFIFAVNNIHETAKRSLIIKTVVAAPDAPRGLGTFLAEKVHAAAKERGYDEVIHALMHEENVSMNVLAGISAPYRNYRLYGADC